MCGVGYMNRKTVIIIVITIVVLALLGLGIFKFIDDIKRDKEAALIQMNEINEYYDSFVENVDYFNLKREELKIILTDLYYENLSKNYSKINTSLLEYDNIIAKIVKDGNNLNDKCGKYYSDPNVNKKCESYKISYETAMNVYTTDIDNYNSLIDKYNEWTKTNTKYKELEHFSSSIIK